MFKILNLCNDNYLNIETELNVFDTYVRGVDRGVGLSPLPPLVSLLPSGAARAQKFPLSPSLPFFLPSPSSHPLFSLLPSPLPPLPPPLLPLPLTLSAPSYVASVLNYGAEVLDFHLGNDIEKSIHVSVNLLS